MKRVIYISQMMKAGELAEACKEFREQEVGIRRSKLKCA